MELIKTTVIFILIMFQHALFSQAIQITGFPVYGEVGLLQGQTDVMNTSDYSVTCYVFVQEAGGWWGPKPSTINPLTPVSADGSFSIDFITGGLDEYCAAFFRC